MAWASASLAEAAWLAVVLVATAANAGEPIHTLDGRVISAQEPGEEFRQRQEGLLAIALARREAEPEDADAWIWVGRRQAYLGRYREAIDVYTEALERFPADARFLRHRGHRLITLRRLHEAAADLTQATLKVEGRPDEVEPDGLPNARGIPTSTLQTNIWYHLGLARYLQRDFGAAAAAYQRCHDLSRNPDMQVASAYWLYLSLRRAGEVDRAASVLAAIEPDLDVIENEGYYEMLLAFAAGTGTEDLLSAVAGERGAVSYPTTAYGVGAWALLEGRSDSAREIFTAIVESPAVAAFGYIAAEAELASRSTAGE